MTYFPKFKFRCTLFSEIRPNFCKPHDMTVFKIHKNAFITFIFFYKTKLILMPQVKNSTTELTLHM